MDKLFDVVNVEEHKKICILALEKYGSRKGSLSKMVEDALKLYIEKSLDDRREGEDDVVT